MTNVVNPHNTLQSIAASLSSASVQANATLNVPGTTNQTLLSLASSGQLMLSSPEGSAAVVAPPALGSPAIAPELQTAGPSTTPTAPTVVANVALSGGYAGS